MTAFRRSWRWLPLPVAAMRPGRKSTHHEADVLISEPVAVFLAKPLRHSGHGNILDQVHIEAVFQKLLLHPLFRRQQRFRYAHKRTKSGAVIACQVTCIVGALGNALFRVNGGKSGFILIDADLLLERYVLAMGDHLLKRARVAGVPARSQCDFDAKRPSTSVDLA